jgi:hypothetical protein
VCRLRRLRKRIDLTCRLAHGSKATTLFRNQIIWIAVLDDRTLIQHKYLVVIDDRLEAMRNRDRRVLNQTNRFLDLGVGRVVNGCGGFVHEQDFRCFEQCARKAEKLALTLREVGAGFGDGRIEIAEGVFVVGLQGGGLGDLRGVGDLAIGHDDDVVVDGVAAGPFAATENGAGVDGRGGVAAMHVAGDGAALGVRDLDRLWWRCASARGSDVARRWL